MAALIPEMPAPATRTVPVGFFSAIISLLFGLTSHFKQFIRFESSQRLLFKDRSSRLIAESGLSLIGARSEQRHQINIIGAGAGTLAATDTEKAHMVHTGQMIEQGVVRHLQHTALIRPHHELLAGVPEGIRDEYTFLAIADRAGNPAIVAVDAGSQFVCQRLKGADLSPKFSKFFIPGLGTHRNQLLHRLVPAGRSFTRLQA